MTVEGQGYDVGDSAMPFTIQSISKPFTYGLVLEDLGEAAVRRRIGVEPTGRRLQLDLARRPGAARRSTRWSTPARSPRSALVAMTRTRPPSSGSSRRYSAAAGRPLASTMPSSRPNATTGHRNRAIGHLLRGAGVVDGDPDARSTATSPNARSGGRGRARR